MYKRLLLNLIVTTCVFLFSCGKGTTETNEPDIKEDLKSEIKVMTYNVHHCNPPGSVNEINVAAIANVINAESPDLVALQEIDVETERSGKTLDQAKELGRLTNMYYYFGKAIHLQQGGEYGVAILSKYPFLEKKQQLLPMKEGVQGEKRTIAWVTVQLKNDKKIIFASTHFDTQNHRLAQAEKVAELFNDAPYPVIIGGDFNDVPGSDAINRLDRNFVRTCRQSCLTTAPASFPVKAIDLIFYKSTNAFEVVKNYTVPEKNASDHLPLVAVLKVN